MAAAGSPGRAAYGIVRTQEQGFPGRVGPRLLRWGRVGWWAFSGVEGRATTLVLQPGLAAAAGRSPASAGRRRGSCAARAQDREPGAGLPPARQAASSASYPQRGESRAAAKPEAACQSQTPRLRKGTDRKPAYREGKPVLLHVWVCTHRYTRTPHT